MKSNNIFRASVIASTQLFKDMVPAIETDDYVHVCIIEDTAKKAYFVISYIWDTRDIISSGLHYEGDACYDAIRMLMTFTDKNKEPYLADDNLSFLKIRDNQTLEFCDYVFFANKEIMTEPAFTKLTSHTEQGDKIRTTNWSVNGIEFCTIDKWYDKVASKLEGGHHSLVRDKETTCKRTSFNKPALQQIFGLLPVNENTGHHIFDVNFDGWSPNVNIGDAGHAPSRNELKRLIETSFEDYGMKFAWNK